MTAKEEAEELYVGFWRLTNDSRIAKQCSLITVYEIIKAIPDASDDDSPYNHELVWWQEVKQEIEKL
jgi:hypothetical protein